MQFRGAKTALCDAARNRPFEFSEDGPDEKADAARNYTKVPLLLLRIIRLAAEISKRAKTYSALQKARKKRGRPDEGMMALDNTLLGIKLTTVLLLS